MEEYRTESLSLSTRLELVQQFQIRPFQVAVTDEKSRIKGKISPSLYLK